MIWTLFVALALLTPAQAAPLRIMVYTMPDQPAGTTDVALWLAPGAPAEIVTQPPLTALPPVWDGVCALTGAVLACTADSDAPLTLRLPAPLRRITVAQGGASETWPRSAPPVWAETTVIIGNSPYAGYRRLTIQSEGVAGVGYIVMPQDGGAAAAMNAYAHGTDNTLCRRLTWYDTYTTTIAAVWVACSVHLDEAPRGEVVIDLPEAISYIDLVEESNSAQRTTRWLLDRGTPVRGVVVLPVVST